MTLRQRQPCVSTAHGGAVHLAVRRRTAVRRHRKQRDDAYEVQLDIADLPQVGALQSKERFLRLGPQIYALEVRKADQGRIRKRRHQALYTKGFPIITGPVCLAILRHHGASLGPAADFAIAHSIIGLPRRACIGACRSAFNLTASNGIYFPLGHHTDHGSRLLLTLRTQDRRD